MINITSKAGRKRYLRDAIKFQMALEKQFGKRLKPIINRQFMTAASLVETGSYGTDQAVDYQRDRLLKLYEVQYKKIFAVAFNRIKDEFEDEKGILIPETKGLADMFWGSIRFFLNTQILKKVNQVNATSKHIMRLIIKKGTEQGKTSNEIAKELRKKGKISSIHRARTIARTETHTAANYGLHETIKQTKIRMEKEWLSANDARVRIDHVLADGERVGINEKFMETGEPMDFPGDPSGSAWNVCNCRCAELFHTVREER